MIRAKLTLFGMFLATFAVLAGVNLLIADRLSPSRFPANVHPYVERFHELFGHRLRLVRYAGAALLAVMVALPTTSQWQSWLLFRNSESFGVADDQFGADVGFYVFDLPFLGFVLDWLFVAMLLVLLLTILAHVLNGGILFASPMPSVRPATKGHVAVLLAVLATLKAADYWVSRYEATNERRGFVQGATYAVVNAQLPALMLLMLIALLTAVLYLSTLRTGSWRLPLIASALWLVVLIAGGLVYPAMVQSLVVNPNQQDRELPYIERNVEATREAMGINLDEVAVRDVTFERLTAQSIESDLAPLQDVRLLNPTEMLSRFRVDRGTDAGLKIDDLDVDRYDIDGRLQQALTAALELDVDGSPNQSWQGRHLINTRGCGLVMAPVGRVLESDSPDYQTVELVRPELYFSPSLSGYAVARTSAAERGCPGGETADYVGARGVQMSSFVRRAAFALAFLDYNVLGSGAIEDNSQMLWVRNVRDRLTKLAPFLSYDGDPYPVVVDGRVQWVVDAYTTTSRYPYAQRVGNEVQLTNDSGLPRDANYVRNSVKAVVDAYDGSVRFYVTDEEDPIIRAWQGAFGDLFSPATEMPERVAPAPALPRGPVPRADRRLLEVPAPAGALLRARGRVVGGPGSEHRPPGVDERGHAGDGAVRRSDAVGAGVGVDGQPLHPLLHDVRRPVGGGHRVRPPAAVRAVLPSRRAHRAAGVHDGVERPGHVRRPHGLRRAGAHAWPASRVQLDRLGTDDHPADRLADRRRQPRAVRRPPTRARGRGPAVGAAVLRGRPAGIGPQHHRHVVPLRHRVRRLARGIG